MTEESKAKELKEKFGDKANDVVDEIMKAVPMYTGNLNPNWKFWQKVKEIINK